GEVLGRIADLTVRRQDTIREDLLKHAQDISARRPDLVALGDKKLLAEHDAYVKQMMDAANNNAFLKNPGPAFRAADKYHDEYPVTQAEAKKLGHFGTMTDEALLRRDLAHYATTHMSANFHPEHGLIDQAGRPLSTGEILAHLRGPEGTGGRM